MVFGIDLSKLHTAEIQPIQTNSGLALKITKQEFLLLTEENVEILNFLKQQNVNLENI